MSCDHSDHVGVSDPRAGDNGHRPIVLWCRDCGALGACGTTRPIVWTYPVGYIAPPICEVDGQVRAMSRDAVACDIELRETRAERDLIKLERDRLANIASNIFIDARAAQTSLIDSSRPDVRPVDAASMRIVAGAKLANIISLLDATIPH